MQITHKNPGKYKTSHKFAWLINLAYIYATVSLFAIGYMVVSFIPETHAYEPVSYVLSCEKAFDDGFFQKIPKVTMKRCGLIFQKMSFEFETGLYKPYQK